MSNSKTLARRAQTTTMLKWRVLEDPEFWLSHVSLDTFNGIYKRLTEIKEKLREMKADAMSGKIKGARLDPAKELRLKFD